MMHYGRRRYSMEVVSRQAGELTTFLVKSKRWKLTCIYFILSLSLRYYSEEAGLCIMQTKRN